ncbi:YceI family protein [Venatoribacter cucullus]|uniref:YceI family protein n=1 Tax=Venatoribacter cucullus TaxID=2661630 RepID=A0A9X7YPU4_9GAMM|nr:YceI family protein [Venatoribacter cucullus]QQD24372.1 YceI family protein [Venatoribacter cucullus]
MRTLILAPLFLFAALAQAGWQLEQPSELTFMSFKNTHLAEVHRFNRLQGNIADNGEATLSIDLSSVDTAIAIRDTRMQEMLFETSRFASATLTAKVNTKVLQQAAAGAIQTYDLAGKLSLHGLEADVSVPVLIVPAADGRLVVTSLKPVLVQADQFELTAGIQKLRDIAKLERISEVVPVNFTLIFSPKP